MDLRQKKTLAAIRTAFLELLGKKPLEKITVKELAEKAQISKATFYLHYQDIYDLAGAFAGGGDRGDLSEYRPSGSGADRSAGIYPGIISGVPFPQ